MKVCFISNYRKKVEKFKYAKIKVQFFKLLKKREIKKKEEEEDKEPLVFKFEVASIGHHHHHAGQFTTLLSNSGT